MYFETQKLSVGYHRRPLIEDIDIGIWQGGILCLIGPNGSGKSTILRSITRHLTKLGGVVAIGGRDLDGMSDKELARHVSVVLTDRIEPELMTCWEVVAAGRYPYTNHFGKLSREDQRIVEDSMARVNALELREQRAEMAEASERKRQSILRVEREWIMRGCKARTTKSKERIQRYEALLNQEAPETDEAVQMVMERWEALTNVKTD